MKKFIVAICGILVAGGAMARSTVEPQQVSDSLRTDWLVDYNDSRDTLKSYYATDMKGVFARSNQFNTNKGTYGNNDEGAIVAIIARNIWENGAKFCTTQIQAAESGSRDWIDYHKSSEKCQIVCKPGYSGSTCADKILKCPEKDTNYLDVDVLDDVLNKPGLLRTSGESDNVITEDVNVFWYQNDEDAEKSYAIVLGVLDRKAHGLRVGPVLVTADDGKMKSATFNNKYTLLCAPGYIANSAKTDCELATQCDFDSSIDVCTGVNADKFESDVHVWVTDNTDNCRYYRCKNSANGLSYLGAGTCETCEQNEKQGIDNRGVCRKCGEGQYFVDKSCENISSGDGISHNDMERCWKIKETSAFKDCVKNKN